MSTHMTIPPYVQQLVKVLRRLTPTEMGQLVQLVPELDIARVNVELSEEQEAVDYFRNAAIELTGGKLPKPSDEFIDGLTYQAYFALSEKEQDTLWKRIFAEEETGPYELEETDAQPGGVATR